jgi:hypothetical protein
MGQRPFSTTAARSSRAAVASQLASYQPDAIGPGLISQERIAHIELERLRQLHQHAQSVVGQWQRVRLHGARVARGLQREFLVPPARGGFIAKYR